MIYEDDLGLFHVMIKVNIRLQKYSFESNIYLYNINSNFINHYFFILDFFDKYDATFHNSVQIINLVRILLES